MDLGGNMSRRLWRNSRACIWKLPSLWSCRIIPMCCPPTAGTSLIHIGALNSAGRLVTTLAPNGRIVCASPAYLEEHLAIEKPEDLRVHRCLALRENNEDVTLWRFSIRSMARRRFASSLPCRPMTAQSCARGRCWALALLFDQSGMWQMILLPVDCFEFYRSGFVGCGRRRVAQRTAWPQPELVRCFWR